MAERNGAEEKKPPRPPRLAERVRAEIIGILLLLVCGFLAAALLTFNAADPSFNSVVSGDGAPPLPQNAMGIVGAYVADLLVQALGLTAYLLPVIFGVFAVRYVILRPVKYAGWVAGGYGAFVLSAAGLLHLLVDRVTLGGGEFYAGGAAGQLSADILTTLFNRPGAYLFLTAGFLVTLLFTVNASLIRFTDRIRHLLMARWQAVREWWILRRERRAKSRAFQTEKKGDRRARPAPKIIAEEDEGKPKPAFQEAFAFVREVGGYKLPPPDIFDAPKEKRGGADGASLNAASMQLLQKLQDFGIEGAVETVRPGPVVTMFEFKPAPGVKINRIVNLSDDLALALRAHSIRIVAPIPGKDTVGVEIPNMTREMVSIREIFDSPAYRQSESPLTMALGKDIAGNPVVADLSKMPHLLIAGATGSGKSVAVHSMIASLLNRAAPRDVRLLVVDPKMLELSVYNGIPHLMLPVVTEAKKAATALRWAVSEMERRYRLMAEEGVRNIATFNKKIEKYAAERTGPVEGTTIEHLPYIVVVIDELADLMMVSSKEVEESIARLAQMARASGIHLIVATQRPSVDVITGMIKANFPARIAFQVASRVDSRTILDSMGAEALLGGGDMLFLPPGTAKLMRVHGSFVSESEIAKLVSFLSAQGQPEYDESILEETPDGGYDDDDGDEYDGLYDQAVAFIVESGQASVSMVQRKFKIGYNRSARMIDRMEREGVVGPSRGAKPREVLARRS